MATLFVDKIDPQSGTTLEIGSSGDTLNLGATAGGTLTNRPAFSAWLKASDQTLSQSVITTMVAEEEFFDTDSAYNTSTGEFTIPTGKQGTYFFNAGFTMSANYALVQAFIYVNGSARFRGNVVRNDASSMTVSTVINLNAGDVVTARVNQNNATNALQAGGDTSNPTRYMCYFSGFKLIGV